MSELADKAIGGDQQSFTDFRKLTACVIASIAGDSGESAAATADRSIFNKAVNYAVGKGEMAADEAVEALIDREAAHLTTILHRTISTAVTVGCRVAGTFVGHFFGPQGIAIGQQIGEKIAEFLNTNISTLIDKGVTKVKDVAKSIYQKGKALLKSGFNKLKSKIFG